jgi:hypothetical protein
MNNQESVFVYVEPYLEAIVVLEHRYRGINFVPSYKINKSNLRRLNEQNKLGMKLLNEVDTLFK